MSAYAAFRRQPVPQQYAQNLRTITIPAPTRGIVQTENDAFMQPGGALVQTNWMTTLKGVKLRGGTTRYADLHALDAPAWANDTAYALDAKVYDVTLGRFWQATAAHTSPTTGNFAEARAASPGRWLDVDDAHTRLPVISAFEYVDSTTRRMYAANATKLFEVTTGTVSLIKDSQNSGNYWSVQMSNMGGNFMVVGNDAGDFLLRTDDGNEFFLLSGVIGNAGDGIPNITYDPTKIPPGVAQGRDLVYGWKYRGRLYFIQKNSMNAWYLSTTDAVGGVLLPIPLSGAATKGGKLIFGATWSIDAGDGIDDKCVFCTNLGELLVFTGSDPGAVANWRQEGRYQIGEPLGMNAHMLVGGDLLVLTVDGVVPVSQAITKDGGQLDLALVSKPIRRLWREESATKRAWPWTMKAWEEQGGILIATPGGTTVATTHCLGLNNSSGAWFVYTWDATCFIRRFENFFFGTQKGRVMQAERSGTDDGRPYVATLVGGWETFGPNAAQTVWHQCRAVFVAGPHEPFVPQLSATVDYVIAIPPPPQPGIDPAAADLWDVGLWDVAHWSDSSAAQPSIQNTMWQSIGMSGFAHAPILQVQVSQAAKPNVELIAIATTQEAGGVNV